MTEKTATVTPTIPQQVRDQYKAAENAYQGFVHSWNDLALTTTDLTFDAMEKGFHFSIEFVGQAQRTTESAFTNYRQIYLAGLKSWQNYVQSINKLMLREI